MVSGQAGEPYLPGPREIQHDLLVSLSDRPQDCRSSPGETLREGRPLSPTGGTAVAAEGASSVITLGSSLPRSGSGDAWLAQSEFPKYSVQALGKGENEEQA